MFLSLLVKTLRDAVRGYGWWTGGLVAYVVLISMVYPFLEERGEAFQELLESYPEGLLAAFGIDTSLSIVSAEGFLATYVFGWFVPLFFLAFAISFAARALAGEEEAGTMDLLLANPIPRSTVVLAKAGALLVLLLGMGAALLVAVVAGGLIVGWDLDPGRLVAACLSGTLLGMAFGGMTFAVGSLTGRRAMTSGIGAGLALGSYLLFTMGGLIEDLATAVKASPIWLYAGTETLTQGLHPGRALILILITVLAAGAATFLFGRRDIRG